MESTNFAVMTQAARLGVAMPLGMICVGMGAMHASGMPSSPSRVGYDASPA
jgi:hypothetical protein